MVVGGEPGTTAITSGSGLQQLPRTLALQVPLAGVGTGGIRDGDTFVVSNGTAATTFEFDTGNGLTQPDQHARCRLRGLTAATDIALAIQMRSRRPTLGLNPMIAGDGLSVYLNLPLDGSATCRRAN